MTKEAIELMTISDKAGVFSPGDIDVLAQSAAKLIQDRNAAQSEVARLRKALDRAVKDELGDDWKTAARRALAGE